MDEKVFREIARTPGISSNGIWWAIGNSDMHWSIKACADGEPLNRSHAIAVSLVRLVAAGRIYQSGAGYLIAETS